MRSIFAKNVGFQKMGRATGLLGRNSKSTCVLKKRVRGFRYARIDPSNRGVMTKAIFVLPKNTRDHNMTKKRGKQRKFDKTPDQPPLGGQYVNLE